MTASQETIWTMLLGLDMKQTYYDAAGVKTRVIEAGEGPPLVFVHGGGGHAEAYIRNIPALAKHYHVYSMDLIGHGMTPYPYDRDATYDDIVKHIGDFQKAIGHDKIALAGMSISAIAVGLYAGQNPGKVTKLVMNTGVPLKTDEAGTARFTGALQKMAEQDMTWSREMVRQRLGVVFHGGADAVPPELVDIRMFLYNRPGFEPIQRKVVGALLKEWTLDGAMNKAGEKALRNIDCPTLLVWTQGNPSQGVPVAKHAQSLMKDCELVVYDGNGHWPQWEDADRFNADVLRLLKK